MIFRGDTASTTPELPNISTLPATSDALTQNSTPAEAEKSLILPLTISLFAFLFIK